MGYLREICIGRTEAQTHGAVCAYDFKNNAKDVEPWFFRITDYTSSLPYQPGYTLYMGVDTYFDNTDEPKREGEPPHVESELTSSTAKSGWPTKRRETYCHPT